jgi:D-lactate dehydrogenase
MPIPVHEENPFKVVYFPSCINQVMGAAKGDASQEPLHQVMTRLFIKAGYEVIFPKNMGKLCCGTIWESKGFPREADRKTAELEAALREASQDGKYPIVCDQSPCLYRMIKTIKGLKLYEPVEFIDKFLMERLDITRVPETIALHVTCSMKKLGKEDILKRVAEACAEKVVIPEEVGCCGFAGDRGFTYPEMNAYALRKLRGAIERSGATAGYSNSRTCEIGLTTNSGIQYQGLVYLVDRCSTSKK